jgi:hypothetical protein
MTYEQFKVEVDHAVAAVMAAQSGLLTDMPNVDYSLTACEAASVITGADETLCKMFNKKFRINASYFAIDRALEMVK